MNAHEPTIQSRLLVGCLFLILLTAPCAAAGGVLDKQRLLDAETFWDNRDWDWYRENIPFFECPNADINTTYYYRWELVTKHLTYGSPNSGYSFTEFIDRPFWSGAYGAISCPAGHQLYEVRWLNDRRYAWDYAQYWFRTAGAQPRRYSTWLADAVWATHQVHPDVELAKQLLPHLIKNFEGWEQEKFDPGVGLFWQTGHDDGMEFNINSRQSQDIVAGAPGYRPTLNTYLWADALAIARIADLAGDAPAAAQFRNKAASLKKNLQEKLWDPGRQAFLHVSKQDEEHEGQVVRALTRTYETGRYAGNRHGRELIGFVPWQFNLPDEKFDAPWKSLLDRDGFFADFGPTTVERRDPQFYISPTCCWWSGQSWPYATTQTLKAMANVLQDDRPDAISKADYFTLLETYTRTHRQGGRPYIAEAANPDTGSWEGHNSFNHSEHYFHSGYCDLIITGLAGLQPSDDGALQVTPLAPEEWDYFALDDLPYQGRRISIVWDKSGERYHLGQGLTLFVNDKPVANSPRLERLRAKLPELAPTSSPSNTVRVNFAVNNDGSYFPLMSASYANAETPVGKLIDGNYWYHKSPPNRWTCEGSPHESDQLVIDLGVRRAFDAVKLYFLDDGQAVRPPGEYSIEYWNGQAWTLIPDSDSTPPAPTGHRANTVHFRQLETDRLRISFTHQQGSRTGLTEVEVWGNAELPIAAAPMPAGNLAFNAGDQPFPKVSASYTSQFDQTAMANDGVISYSASPHNRWTSYESNHREDWLEVDFGAPRQVSRLELAIYDDRGGVQGPQSFGVEFWTGEAWQAVEDAQKSPAEPIGNQINEVRFRPVTTRRVRVAFKHQPDAQSGISEIMAWSE